MTEDEEAPARVGARKPGRGRKKQSKPDPTTARTPEPEPEVYFIHVVDGMEFLYAERPPKPLKYLTVRREQDSELCQTAAKAWSVSDPYVWRSGPHDVTSILDVRPPGEGWQKFRSVRLREPFVGWPFMTEWIRPAPNTCWTICRHRPRKGGLLDVMDRRPPGEAWEMVQRVYMHPNFVTQWRRDGH